MIYSIICSRKDKPNNTLPKLLSYYQSADIKYHISYDANSMFEGYQSGIDALKPDPEDIVILCHDDIEVLSDRAYFRKTLEDTLSQKNVGFVGPAGTTYLGGDAVWWDINRRHTGLHSGFVFQGKDHKTMTPNYFGPCRNVVVLDGLFLAAKRKTLDLVGLAKPKEFPTNWDFYDLYYTLSAYEKGYDNKAIPILILHNSDGFMRESWEANRKAFQKMFRLPVGCKNV
jgi:hypothetical protein